MTEQEFLDRVRAVKSERAKGNYVDALELEVELWRDLGGIGANAAWESLAVGGPTATLVHRARIAARELRPTTSTI